MAYRHKDALGTERDFQARDGTSATVPTVDVVTALPVVLGYRRQAVGGTAEALEGPGGGAIPTGATHVIVEVAGVSGTDPNVRFTRDGSTTPTATLGRILQAGSLNEIAGDLSDVSLIAESGSVNIDLEYLRYA